MEVIRLSGYTEDEKVNDRPALPAAQADGEQRRQGRASWRSPRTRIRDIVRYYTREAGVRALEREISKICRKVVKGLVLKKTRAKVVVDAENLDEFLGVRKYSFGVAEKENQVGQVTGLAWTEVGGDLLTIEAAVMPGKGNIIRTGSLGDVMKESVEAAPLRGAQPCAPPGHRRTKLSRRRDIHIHVPEGATPKDGP